MGPGRNWHEYHLKPNVFAIYQKFRTLTAKYRITMDLFSGDQNGCMSQWEQTRCGRKD